jgi:hypothetical protein
MSIEGGAGMGGSRGVEAARRELKHLVDLMSNCSTISSIVAPASRFSNTAETGIRVLRNTHAPLSRPGTLSTAGHCDQSRVDILVAPSTVAFTIISRLRHAGGRPGCPPRCKTRCRKYRLWQAARAPNRSSFGQTLLLPVILHRLNFVPVRRR